MQRSTACVKPSVVSSGCAQFWGLVASEGVVGSYWNLENQLHRVMFSGAGRVGKSNTWTPLPLVLVFSTLCFLLRAFPNTPTALGVTVDKRSWSSRRHCRFGHCLRVFDPGRRLSAMICHHKGYQVQVAAMQGVIWLKGFSIQSGSVAKVMQCLQAPTPPL